MNKVGALLAVAAAAVVAIAYAEMPTPGGPPRMEFRTIPFEGAPSAEHKVTPYRFFDKVVVTVWDPVACGQKPVNPTFSIQGEKLHVAYSLTAAGAKATPCTLVSEFDVLDVPNRELVVSFAGGPEPYIVSSMKKCPFYSPSSGDIWECLVPAAQVTGKQ